MAKFKKPATQWHNEWISPDEFHAHGIDRIILEKKTPFQSLQVIETPKYGRCLVLDGEIQSAAVDEFIYHEALVHPAMLNVGSARQILLVGGGEGATLREIYRHSGVERVTMVDIDAEVVEACKQHLQEIHQDAFDDARTQVVIDDAKNFVATCKQRFDLIISDISQAHEGTTAAYMFTREFFEQAAELLTDRGILVLQSGAADMQDCEFFVRLNRTLKTVFPQVLPYAANVPSFRAHWGFQLAMKQSEPKPLEWHEIDAELSRRGLERELRFYDGLTHRHIFSLPKHLRVALKRQMPIYTVTDKPALYKAQA